MKFMVISLLLFGTSLIAPGLARSAISCNGLLNQASSSHTEPSHAQILELVKNLPYYPPPKLLELLSPNERWDLAKERFQQSISISGMGSHIGYGRHFEVILFSDIRRIMDLSEPNEEQRYQLALIFAQVLEHAVKIATAVNATIIFRDQDHRVNVWRQFQLSEPYLERLALQSPNTNLAQRIALAQAAPSSREWDEFEALSPPELFKSPIKSRSNNFPGL